MKERRLCTEPSNNDINQLEEFNQQKQGTFLRSLIMPKLYFKRHTDLEVFMTIQKVTSMINPL